ncbi:putative WPP domain-associated protein [Helianthus annuus]|nr:putative WPP domain-associated protein [Helianthus annuus]KAJ0654830.1 putative WPP domain-associated protein [Helianthus annuus]
MGSQEVLEDTMGFDSTDGIHDLESKQVGLGTEHNESVGVEFLDDLDKMIEEEVDKQLKVARMVSDSVIKGMVSAVEQDADEKIKAKESELERLKSSISFFNGDRNESSVDFIGYASFEDVIVKHDKTKESVTDEFKRLRKQIEGVKGCKIKRNGSYEILGLGGILKEEYDLEKTVDNLETMMNSISKMVDTVLTFSKNSLNEWQHKHELKEELEDMVIQSSIKCIRDEFEEAGSQNLRLAEKFSNISDLRNELESLTKLLPSNDSGHLISHGSLDIDMTHGNPLRSQLSTELKPDDADSFDANSLGHMNKEEMVKFFNNYILKLKRDHEAEVHQITDNYIKLRGIYLSERRSFVPHNKDFEVLTKKIPDVVAKLDEILNASDEFIGKGDKVVSLNTVLRENRQLRDALSVTKDEVNNLSSRLTVVSEKHKSSMADSFIEASIVADVYKCVVRQLNCCIQNMKEESEVQISAMHDVYEVLLENAVIDTRMESLLVQELLGTVFKETLTDVNQKVENLHEKYATAREKLVFLETQATRMKADLILETEEREKLRNQVNMLRSSMEEKETLARDEINNLRKTKKSSETLLLKANKELDEMSEKLLKAEEKLLSDEMEIISLNDRLALVMEETKTSNEYKNKVVDLSEEKQRFMSQIEAKEREHRKQMEAVVVLVDELSAKFVDFERRLTWDVKSNYTRLENSRTQLSSLVMAANALKNAGIVYKQNLERKCRDLQMAEEEVDLLGDEVETLCGLLEKIYIALDHYSPVLKHYPGVIEILELVRRELSGEAVNAHRHR